MELNSPRKDPYSTFAMARKELSNKGYDVEFTVMDETTIRDSEGKEYQPADLTLDHLVRVPNRETQEKGSVYAGDVSRQKQHKEVKALYALHAKNGVKGILEEHMNEQGSEVIERFLQNVDRHDALKEYYTA